MDFLTFLESQLGWPNSTNTWEPMEHLNCEELIKEFEQKQKPGEFTSILLGFF
jgi:Chromo (CHRromatin Organisation MOdifier) domain